LLPNLLALVFLSCPAWSQEEEAPQEEEVPQEQEAPVVGGTSMSSIEVAGPRRTAHDTVVFVRIDGQLYLQDDLVRDVDLPTSLGKIRAADPHARVIIEADEDASHGRVQEVVQMAHDAGFERVAMDFSAIDVGTERDRLDLSALQGAEGAEVEEMEESMSKKELRQLKPKRWKFPQNPYGSTDFTAYTLEWGEAKLGLFNVGYGVLPRTQLGTIPVLDGFGVYNADLKVNALREGRFDLALLGAFYYVPVNDLVSWADEKFELGLMSGDFFTDNITVLQLGGMTSLQLAKPWSLHLGLLYARVAATGEMDFGNLPEVLMPSGGDGEQHVVSSLAAEAFWLRVATDVRFNRRDSLVLQFQAPFHARARGAMSTQIEGLGNLDDIEVLLSYGGFIPFSSSFMVSLSWQLSWKHVEARLGGGYSGVPGAWLLQAFDISYRFGGKTRRQERKIRKGYRQNVKSLKRGEEQEGEE